MTVTDRRPADIAKLLARLKIDARADGDEFIALCPGHTDTRPSWSINRQTGKHHCFSCGFGGTVASLVIHVLDVAGLGWSRGDAWKWMEEQGLLVGDGERALSVELYLKRDERPRFVLPATVRFAESIAEWPTPAVRYLAGRRIAGWQVRRWGIGYAIAGRLEGRVVIPVRDARGTPLTYTARTFTGARVRYLTPAEDEHPDTSALFGEQFWPSAGHRDLVVVVEGAIKGLAVERAAPGVAVAGVLGVTQSRNLRALSKLSSFARVIVLFDRDAAGEGAADELRWALARHTRVELRQMPGAAVDDAPEAEVREACTWRSGRPG